MRFHDRVIHPRRRRLLIVGSVTHRHNRTPVCLLCAWRDAKALGLDIVEDAEVLVSEDRLADARRVFYLGVYTARLHLVAGN